MEQWYREAGATEIVRGGLGRTMGVSTHAYGGTRMGDNAETNVVNRFGVSHEVPNLGIAGASVMGTSGARRRCPGERLSILLTSGRCWRTNCYCGRL